jgi:hypothetical protein
MPEGSQPAYEITLTHFIVSDDAERAREYGRALTRDRALKAQGYDQAGEFARAPLKCLVSLLDESYVGGA